MTESLKELNIIEIMKTLPHRSPFLLVDRVVELVPNERIAAIKNVTFNEPYFTGHFPLYPVMPGVLVIEACAQAAGILSFKSFVDDGQPGVDFLDMFAGIDNARFKAQVVPGDQLRLEVTIGRRRSNICKYQAVATVAGKVAAEAEITCARVPLNKKG